MAILPDLSVFAAFALAVVLLALTPGPDMVFYIGRALSGGRRTGFAALAGAVAGIFVHSLMVAIGLAALLAASATAFIVLKVFGALYLLWLAVDILRKGTTTRFEVEAGGPKSLRATFFSGLAINLLNPKIIMFFVTFLPQFVAAADPHATAKLLALGLAFIVIASPVCIALILTAERFAAALKRSPRALRIFDLLFAGLMASFAIRLLVARSS